MVRPLGLEPRTYELKARYSTNWVMVSKTLQNNLAVRKGIEPIFPPWKGSVLTDRRTDQKLVPSERFELPTNSLQNCCTTAVLQGRIDTCPMLPQNIVGFPSLNRESKPYPRNRYVFKQQEQSRRTLYQPYTTIIAHKAAFYNTKNSNKINNLHHI